MGHICMQSPSLLSAFQQLLPVQKSAHCTETTFPEWHCHGGGGRGEWLERGGLFSKHRVLYTHIPGDGSVHKDIHESLGTSPGNRAWRTGNKNSPFGCWFSSFALGGDCFSSQVFPAPLCSLAPPSFRVATTEHCLFSLNILSKLASSSLAKSLLRQQTWRLLLPKLEPERGGRCPLRGSSFGSGTEDHTALQVDPSH